MPRLQPSQRLHVYVLSNAERNFANPETFATRIAERVMGRAAPAFVALPAAELEAYVGVYRVSADERRVVTRDGERLFLQRGRGARQEIRALGSNEFMNPNTGTRFTFVREGGRVTGLLVNPRIGPREAVSPRTQESPGEALAAPASRVTVPMAVLDSYAGEYQLAPDFIIAIRREGDGLKGRATGQGDITLVAQTETRFAAQEVQATVEFERDASGAVTRLMLTQGGRTLPAPKIK